MQPSKWDVHFKGLEPVVGKLFTNFTCQMWLLLNKNWLADPSNIPASSTFQEAMECWSIAKIYGTVTACVFEACNMNLPGWISYEWPQKSFSPQAFIYFPSSENGHHSWSPWNAFHSKPGYLWQFHKLMKVCNKQEQFYIMDRSKEIFSNLHCFFASLTTLKKVLGKPWMINKQGKIQFIMNLIFYKLLRLTEDGKPFKEGLDHELSSLWWSSPWICIELLAMMNWLQIKESISNKGGFI